MCGKKKLFKKLGNRCNDLRKTERKQNNSYNCPSIVPGESFSFHSRVARGKPGGSQKNPWVENAELTVQPSQLKFAKQRMGEKAGYCERSRKPGDIFPLVITGVIVSTSTVTKYPREGNDHRKEQVEWLSESQRAAENWHSHRPEWKKSCSHQELGRLFSTREKQALSKGCSGCSTQKSIKANLRRNKNIVPSGIIIPEKKLKNIYENQKYPALIKNKKIPNIWHLKKNSQPQTQAKIQSIMRRKNNQ